MAAPDECNIDRGTGGAGIGPPARQPVRVAYRPAPATTPRPRPIYTGTGGQPADLAAAAPAAGAARPWTNSASRSGSRPITVGSGAGHVLTRGGACRARHSEMSGSAPLKTLYQLFDGATVPAEMTFSMFYGKVVTTRTPHSKNSYQFT